MKAAILALTLALTATASYAETFGKEVVGCLDERSAAILLDCAVNNDRDITKALLAAGRCIFLPGWASYKVLSTKRYEYGSVSKHYVWLKDTGSTVYVPKASFIQ